MVRKTKEKLKTNILILLIGLSFVQVSIIWESRTHGVPKSPFAFHTVEEEMRNLAMVEEVIKPTFILVSSKSMNTHVRISRDRNEYDILWNLLKENLAHWLEMGVLIEEKSLQDDEWKENYHGTYIEATFHHEMKIDVILDILQVRMKRNLNKMDVQRVLFQYPESSSNEVFVYAINQFQDMVKYRLVLKEKSSQVALMSNLLDSQALKVDSRELIEFSEEELENIDFILGAAIFDPIDSQKVVSLKNMYINMPFKIYAVDRMSKSQLRAIKKAVLGVDHESYEDSIRKTSGDILLSNLSNVYRINENGILEYHYLLEVDVDKNSLEQYDLPIIAAYDFIMNKNLLNDMTQIKLSHIQLEPNGEYTLRFNYEFNGVKVDILSEDHQKVDAIELRVKNSKVVYCRWVIRNLYFDETEVHQVNLSMKSILSTLISRVPKQKILQIEDVYQIPLNELYSSRRMMKKLSNLEQSYYFLPEIENEVEMNKEKME
jgi:hypothetical protein